MKVLKGILFALLALAALFVVVGFFLPSTWQVSRSTIINASPEAVYNNVGSFKKWEEWSPWTKESDSSLQYTYEGPEIGTGAKQSWTSDKMGTGWMKMLDADAQRGIKYELFIDMGQFQNTLHGDMAFEANGSQTKVTWTDHGDAGKNLIKKWMALMMGSMLGSQLEQGLSKLKTVTEANVAG